MLQKVQALGGQRTNEGRLGWGLRGMSHLESSREDVLSQPEVRGGGGGPDDLEKMGLS